MARDAKLADQQGPEGQVEDLGRGGGHRDTAPGKAQHQGVRALAELRKGGRQLPSCVVPVLKNHGHGFLFRCLRPPKVQPTPVGPGGSRGIRPRSGQQVGVGEPGGSGRCRIRWLPGP
jgi:hypothetical protein